MNAPIKVSEDGRIVLPQDVLDQLGIGPGSDVTFRRSADGNVVLEKVALRDIAERIEALRGHAGPGLSTDEIMLMTRGNLNDDTY